MRKILTYVPLILIFALMLTFYLTDFYHFLTFDALRQDHLKWKQYVEIHPLLSAIYFLGVYIVSVILVIPDSTILTILSGFLFPIPLAILYSCIAETIGATLFFLAARLAFKESFGREKTSRWNEMKKKFQADEVYYLLFLRFYHLIPFWIVNLGAGILRVSTKTFIWTTLIGVLPLAYFLAEGGSSLSQYFEHQAAFKLRSLFTTQLKISLIVLSVITLLPLAYKKYNTIRKK